MMKTRDRTEKHQAAPARQRRAAFSIEKRAYERYASSLQARLFYGDLIYSGMVTNISRNGMFLRTNVQFPVNSEFMAVILLKDRTLKFPVKVRRSAIDEKSFHCGEELGVGIELLDAPQSYIDYIGSRKSSQETSF